MQDGEYQFGNRSFLSPVFSPLVAKMVVVKERDRLEDSLAIIQD